jgi:hypothetical protein
MLSEALNGQFYQLCTMLTHTIMTRYTYGKYRTVNHNSTFDNYLTFKGQMLGITNTACTRQWLNVSYI